VRLVLARDVSFVEYKTINVFVDQLSTDVHVPFYDFAVPGEVRIPAGQNGNAILHDTSIV
jgi:hypothetical protein